MTRRHLIRVCKKWHRIALLFLYEWVRVSRLKHLEGIVQALEQRRFGGSDTCVGWCTKRLDIDLRWMRREEVYHHQGRYQEALLVDRLLLAVPNLLVLTIGNCHNPLWVPSPSFHIYCPKLEFLNMSADWEDTGVWLDTWTLSFIHSHPNLIAIHILTMGLRTQTSPPHALKELTTAFKFPVSVGSVFTSLSRLNLNLCSDMLGDAGPRWHRDLMTQPLPSVTTLQICFMYGLSSPDYAIYVLSPLLQFLPNLHRIDFVLPEWPRSGWFTSYVFPAGVSVLGLRVCSLRPKRQTIKQLLHQLNQVVRGALSPLKVQFLDGNTMQNVCMHKEYVLRNSEAGDILQSWLDPDGNVYDLPLNF